MASTYATNSGMELIGSGDQTGIWGTTTNTNLQIIDRLTNGVGAVSVGTGTTYTLTTSSAGALSEGQYKVLVLGGTPSATNTVTISPNTAQHMYLVKNNTARSIILTQGTGGTVTLTTGTSKIVYCDGAGATAAVVDLTSTFALSSATITGGSITGLQLLFLWLAEALASPHLLARALTFWALARQLLPAFITEQLALLLHLQVHSQLSQHLPASCLLVRVVLGTPLAQALP